MSDLLKLLHPGQRLFVSAGSTEPIGLLSELSALPLPDNLDFVQFPLPGFNSIDFTSWNHTACISSFFMTPTLAEADARRLQFLPMQMRHVYDYLTRNIDVAVLQVARDPQGVLRLAPNADFVDAVLQSASVVIAELNHGVVAGPGCPPIDAASIDYLFETDHPLLAIPAPTINAAAATIGRLVAELIDDGDCIQTGIGAIPAAILMQLESKNDLGMHGGLIDDGGMRLLQNGNINGSRKPIATRLHVTCMALGSQALYDFVVETPELLFRPANYTHEVAVLRQLPNFVSVNSAVEIDLFGQINAEYTGGRQISGTGGSVDFMRGAKASPGGRSIVALNATARRGSVSRIVPKVEMVTALRTDVDTVVTEYGVAQIKHLPSRERAQALIQLAAPEFRDELAAAAAEI